MQADQHVWKTADGRLVAADNLAATTLVYAPGDEVEPRHETAVRALGGQADHEQEQDGDAEKAEEESGGDVEGQEPGGESTAGVEGQSGEDKQASQPKLSKQAPKGGDKAARVEGDK